MISKFDSINRNNLLYVDVGNSVLKAAFKSTDKWESLNAGEIKNASELVKWINGHPKNFSGLVISSVRKDVAEAIFHEEFSIPKKVITASDIPPELLDYRTPETLGIDRFLACYGATNLTENAAVVIDAGTATTIDFMGADDVFRGGLIAPGYISFSNILKTKAPALPDVEHDLPEIWPGKSTVDSMKWGQAGFYKMAIENILKKYEEAYGDFDLFITGGDAEVIEKILGLEQRVRPFLVFEGMERVVGSTES